MFVLECPRAYLTENGPAYALPDLENTARAQLAAEDVAAAAAAPPGLLFCDTDLTVIKSGPKTPSAPAPGPRPALAS